MTADQSSYLYEELTYRIRGAIYEVYNTLGPGFKELVYHRALAKELTLRDIPFSEKPRLSVTYKGERVGVYEPDFIVDRKVIVEVKSVTTLPSISDVQLYYY